MICISELTVWDSIVSRASARDPSGHQLGRQVMCFSSPREEVLRTGRKWGRSRDRIFGTEEVYGGNVCQASDEGQRDLFQFSSRFFQIREIVIHHGKTC